MFETVAQAFEEKPGYIYNENEELRRSQRLLAGLVGAVALLLPASLILLGEGLTEGRTSISSYYYEGILLGDVFVGGLFLVGGLMLTYRGNSDLASLLATIGGVLAMLVAGFPTSGWSRCATLFKKHAAHDCDASTGSPWFWEGTAHFIHITSAISLFVVLALFCYFVFLKPRKRKAFDGHVEDNSGDSSKKRRNLIYWVCFAVLILAMVAMALSQIESIGLPEDTIFWGESAGLIAFGVAWLTHSRFFFVRFLSDKDDPIYWGGKSADATGLA